MFFIWNEWLFEGYIESIFKIDANLEVSFIVIKIMLNYVEDLKCFLRSNVSFIIKTKEKQKRDII